jgi:hypothetical protein
MKAALITSVTLVNPLNNIPGKALRNIVWSIKLSLANIFL